jgi:hypothetical protein
MSDYHLKMEPYIRNQKGPGNLILHTYKDHL